jgi:hypothetical protein
MSSGLWASAGIFRFIAPAFVAGGLVHLTAIFLPQVLEPVPLWYHLLFVAVNFALAYGVLRRPRGFIPIFALYVVQQYVEHLPRCIEVWQHEHRFDAPGFAPLVFVPFVLVLLIRDARRSRAGTGAPVEASI